MHKMKRHIKASLTFAALMTLSAIADAQQLFEYTYTGTVASGEDTAGIFTGAPGTNLAGYAFTAAIEVNLANGMPDNGETYLQIIGGTSDGYPASYTPIVNSIITINGTSIAIDGGYYSDIASPSTGGLDVAAVSSFYSSSLYPCDVDSPNLPYSLSTPVADYQVVASDSTDCQFSIYNSSTIGGLAYGALTVASVSVVQVSGFAPIASPEVTGTLGANGWYVSPTTVTWVVSGIAVPTTSGCATKTVPNSTGRKYTCSATNSLGSVSDSIIVKVDSVKPAVTITAPASGATFALNSTVYASYTCSDKTSGVALCSGTVADGAPITTSTKGKKKFIVTSADNAGNTETKSVTYTVN